MSPPSDLLDRLARRSVGSPPTRSSPDVKLRPAQSPSTAESTFSRSFAVKLAVVAALSGMTALWRVPTGKGQAVSRDQCLLYCASSHQDYLKERMRSCANVLQPKAITIQDDWKRIRTILRYGAFSFVWDLLMRELELQCYTDAQNETSELLRKCLEKCDGCPRSSSQSEYTVAAPTCEVKRPPRPSPPSIPPPPPQSAPGTCGAADLVAGAVCCPSKQGWVQCYTGCASNGDGCCASLPGSC